MVTAACRRVTKEGVQVPKKKTPLPQHVEELMDILGIVPTTQASYERDSRSHDYLVHAAAEDSTGPKEVTFIFSRQGVLKGIDLCCYKCRMEEV